VRMVLAALLLSTGTCAPERCTGSGVPLCPVSTGAVSSKITPAAAPFGEKVFFRNAAPFAADILRVGVDGIEVSQGILPSGMRRSLFTQHGDVWLARAVRPGTVADRRLLLEHRVGTVPIEDCDCPQPQFVDCSKPPTQRDDTVISDPVVFENRAAEPIDVFFWNGTCEELVSWDEVGGVQPLRHKPLLSTQGHSFRLRSAATRKMLMAHTLNDLVIRACDEDEARLRGSTVDGLEALRAQTRFFEAEAAALRDTLATELARLALALARGSNATDPAAEHAKHGGALLAAVGVVPHGATWSQPALGLAK